MEEKRQTRGISKEMSARFRPQCSMRLLFALTTIVAVVFSLHASRLRDSRLQREAVARIRDMGGIVFYDYEAEGLESHQRFDPKPSWFCRFFGEDYCHDAIVVYLSSNEICDKDLECLKSLRGLYTLTVESDSVSDKGIETLCQLRKLELLWVSGGSITEDGIARLRSGLPDCEIEATIEG